eukprot:m.25200 g.25200  ORF g.25200 m.25200 type:complete len:220 (+) comp5737_c0_seq1:1722-2381(+)
MIIIDKKRKMEFFHSRNPVFPHTRNLSFLTLICKFPKCYLVVKKPVVVALSSTSLSQVAVIGTNQCNTDDDLVDVVVMACDDKGNCFQLGQTSPGGAWKTKATTLDTGRIPIYNRMGEVEREKGLSLSAIACTPIAHKFVAWLLADGKYVRVNKITHASGDIDEGVTTFAFHCPSPECKAAWDSLQCVGDEGENLRLQCSNHCCFKIIYNIVEKMTVLK